MGQHLPDGNGLFPAPAEVRKISGNRVVQPYFPVLNQDQEGWGGGHHLGQGGQVEPGFQGHRLRPGFQAAMAVGPFKEDAVGLTCQHHRAGYPAIVDGLANGVVDPGPLGRCALGTRRQPNGE